jgi:hypothetical protein
MTLTQRLKLELVIREHIDAHGELFFTELGNILEKIQNEKNIDDPRGKPCLRVWRL